MDNKKPIDIPISIQRYFNIMNLLGYSIITPEYFYNTDIISDYVIKPQGKKYQYIDSSFGNFKQIEYIRFVIGLENWNISRNSSMSPSQYDTEIGISSSDEWTIALVYTKDDWPGNGRWFSCEEFEKEFLSIIRDYKLGELC